MTQKLKTNLSLQKSDIHEDKRYQFTPNCYWICNEVEVQFSNDFGMSMDNSIVRVRGVFALVGFAEQAERMDSIEKFYDFLSQHPAVETFHFELSPMNYQLETKFIF